MKEILKFAGIALLFWLVRQWWSGAFATIAPAASSPAVPLASGSFPASPALSLPGTVTGGGFGGGGEGGGKSAAAGAAGEEGSQLNGLTGITVLQHCKSGWCFGDPGTGLFISQAVTGGGGMQALDLVTDFGP